MRRIAPRFARLATNAIVRRPLLWRVFRAPLRRMFDALAPQWEQIVSPEHAAPLEAAVATIETPPRRILDLGTGTGRAARALARRFPDATVVGIDLAPEMIARAEVPPELAGRLRFQVGDASALPFADREFDLVTLVNMIPFFDELARVVAPGGTVVCSFSRGEETPIFVPPARLRRELERRDFTDFAEVRAGAGLAVLARRRGAR